MSDLITTDLVRLDGIWAPTSSTSSGPSRLVGGAGRATDAAQLVEDVLAREATSSTGLPAVSRSRTAAPPVSRSPPGLRPARARR